MSDPRGDPSPLPAGLILCGGQSRRLGTDKAFLPVGEIPLIERVIRALRPVSSSLHLVADRRDRFDHLGLSIIEDRRPHAGPLAALADALASVAAPLVFVASCDLPFLTPDYFRMLQARLGEADAAMPWTDTTQAPLAALYRPRVASVARTLLARGVVRLMDLMPELNLRRIDESELSRFPPSLLLNVNTPDDARRAEELMQGEP